MRTSTRLIATIVTIPIVLAGLSAAAPKGGKRGKGRLHRGHADKTEQAAEHAAMREEALLDHRDTHKWKADPAARDRRPENLKDYHNHTYNRIVRLLHHGAITEQEGLEFKTEHTAINDVVTTSRADGNLTEDERRDIRSLLNKLNDDINGKLDEAEQASARTPLLNRQQHRFDEQIEFGVRSGRLSKGEASRLQREVKKLASMEDRLKADDKLSTSEREKLMEEAAELRREIRKALTD